MSYLTSGALHAFLWENGTMTDLGALGEGETRAEGINNRGQAVGMSHIPNQTGSMPHAFLWQDGTMIDLGTLGGVSSWAYGINNRGQVVGFSDTDTGEMRAFLWER